MRRIPYLAFFILIRLILHALLYHQGFESLTADEFGRTVLAARWAQHPYNLLSGPWLPFPIYIHGLALMFVWELLWIPRGLTIITGILLIVVLYYLNIALFEDPKIGWIGAFLLTLNPVHIWLSSTPLTEGPYTLLVLCFLYSSILYLKTENRKYLYLSIVWLTIANGFRLEAWIVSMIFTLLMGVRIAKNCQGKKLIYIFKDFAVIAIPWIFPLIWIAANYITTHDPLATFNLIRSYKRAWYFGEGGLKQYLNAFLTNDPFITILFPIGAILGCKWCKIRMVFSWYLIFAFFPLVIFMLMHGGQVEPWGNIIRYLAPFAFILYPLLSILLYKVAVVISNRLTWQFLSTGTTAIVLLALTSIVQLNTTFHFVKDPVSDGLKVGLKIRHLRKQSSELNNRPVVIELSYWQYLAIQVGANDINGILYDRVLDYEHRQTQSLISSDSEAFLGCIAQYKIGYLVIKSPELIEIVERKFRLSPLETINEYAFYEIPEDFDNATSIFKPCPLYFSDSYR